MHRIFKRAAIWNSKRYEQEYNHTLTLSLLNEEFKEWLEAVSEVDKLDALCDIIYVALGALWKAKLINEGEEAAAELASGLVEVFDEPHYAYFIAAYLAVMEYEQEYSLGLNLHLIIKVALMEMLALGLNYEQCIDALLVVCDSNDSKSIKKTDSSLKANSGNKGPYFVAPEPRLQLLLDKRANHENS